MSKEAYIGLVIGLLIGGVFGLVFGWLLGRGRRGAEKELRQQLALREEEGRELHEKLQALNQRNGELSAD